MNKTCKYGHTGPRYKSGACIECTKIRSAKYYQRDRSKILERHAIWYMANPDKKYWIAAEKKQKRRLRRKEYLVETKERRKEYYKKYWKENKALARALCANRKARKLKAMPKWADKDAIRIIYDAASSLGRDYHVDHIVPLYNPEVCGLHVPWNLRIVPAAQNISKHNSFDPETPCGYHPDTYKILFGAGVGIPKDLIP